MSRVFGGALNAASFNLLSLGCLMESFVVLLTWSQLKSNWLILHSFFPYFFSLSHLVVCFVILFPCVSLPSSYTLYITPFLPYFLLLASFSPYTPLPSLILLLFYFPSSLFPPASFSHLPLMTRISITSPYLPHHTFVPLSCLSCLPVSFTTLPLDFLYPSPASALHILLLVCLITQAPTYYYLPIYRLTPAPPLPLSLLFKHHSSDLNNN